VAAQCSVRRLRFQPRLWRWTPGKEVGIAERQQEQAPTQLRQVLSALDRWLGSLAAPR
jgi:hypothetical protein